MEKRIAELDAVTSKLVSLLFYLFWLTRLTFAGWKRKQFRRMNAVIDGMEALLIEAHKAKGWHWVSDEPLWVTWSLEKFGTRFKNDILPDFVVDVLSD
jgi:hypothetical protein